MMYQKHWQVFLRHSVLGLKHIAAASAALWYSLRIKLIKTLQVRLIPCACIQDLCFHNYL